MARAHALIVEARQRAPLLAILAAGLAFTAYYTLKVTEYSVMTDELLYERLSLSIGDTLSPVPHVHGDYFAVFSQLYPLLTAPFFHFFDMPAAFRMVHFVNAVLMVSTAIPAYLLAREVVSHKAGAYLVAALTIAIPWMTMSTMVLTDVAAYPAFVWAILWLQRAMAAPSASRDLLALVGLGLAFAGRTQFILLALITPVAVVAHEVGFLASGPDRVSARDALRIGFTRAVTEHRVLSAATALGLVVAVPLALAGSISGVLGNYDASTERSLLPAGLWNAMAVHLDVVVVGVGILPFVLALGWCVSTLWRPLERREHAYAVLMVLVVALLTFQVSSFSLNFARGVTTDRYLFYVVPLLAVGMVACLLGARKPWRAVLPAGLAFAAVVGVADYSKSPGPYFSSPASAFYWVIDGRTWALTLGAILLTIAAAWAIRSARREVAFWAVGLFVLAFCMFETRYVFHRIVIDGWENRVISGTETKGRGWIDDAVPADASVGIVPAPVTTFSNPSAPRALPAIQPEFQDVWWEAEFWNKRIDQAYSYLGSPTYSPFPHGRITIDYATGRLNATDQSQYLVLAPNDPRFRPAGRLVASKNLELVQARLPYQAEWATQGVAADGRTQLGYPASVRVFAERGQRSGRRVSLTFSSGAAVPSRYRIDARGLSVAGRLPPSVTLTRTIQLCLPPSGFSDVTIALGAPQGAVGLVELRLWRVRTRPSATACRARPA